MKPQFHHRKPCFLIAILFAVFIFLGCQQPDKAATTKTDSTSLISQPSTEWLKTLYTKTLDPNLFNTDSITIVHYTELSDSISYCIFSLKDELCTSSFLATQVNRRNKQISQIEESCDGDYSNPVYTYSQFRFDPSSNTTVTTEYVETAKPEFVIEENGEKRFREGYTLENAKTTLDSMVVIRKVLPDGKISETSN